ncbi:cyclic AMP-dependent transcription factor ATF-6 alpha-like isoform X1 [Artemia franciscana]|uniref:BZIP domain-containing protein n=1 Tax=Artemia franciscana TaxID=6661 RepID=A0AA88L8A6_ARTSF|nr:hypothetical protein QYM36_004585 [Artemia franciscana]
MEVDKDCMANHIFETPLCTGNFFGDENFFCTAGDIELLSSDVLLGEPNGHEDAFNVDISEDKKDVLNEIIALSKSADFEEESSSLSPWEVSTNICVKDERSSPDSGIMFFDNSSGSTTPKSEPSDLCMDFLSEAEAFSFNADSNECTSLKATLPNTVDYQDSKNFVSEPSPVKILTISPDGTVNVKNGKSVATTKSVQTSSENAAFKPRTVLVKNASAVKVPISKPKSAKPVLVKTEVIGNLVTSGLVTADQPVRVKLEPSCAISTHKTTLPIAPKPLFPFANSMVGTPSHSAPNAEAARRQQRMIRNREAASLSRKKKKEYMDNLEQEISRLAKINEDLEEENRLLKERLSELQEQQYLVKSGYFNVNPKKVTAFFGISILLSWNLISLGGIPWTSSTKPLEESTLNIPVHRSFGRSLRSISDEDIYPSANEYLTNFTNDLNFLPPVCPMLINTTESLRLNSDLSDLFTKKQPKETKPTKKETVVSLSPFLSSRLRSIEKRKEPKGINYIIPSVKKDLVPKDNLEVNNRWHMRHEKVIAFMNSIERRDDTYYVVSFSPDHLLVPASSQNSTMRPKMSLVLPAMALDETVMPPANHVAMMQIDCEVTNTRLLHVQESVVSSLNSSRMDSSSSRVKAKLRKRSSEEKEYK